MSVNGTNVQNDYFLSVVDLIQCSNSPVDLVLAKSAKSLTGTSICSPKEIEVCALLFLYKIYLITNHYMKNLLVLVYYLNQVPFIGLSTMMHKILIITIPLFIVSIFILSSVNFIQFHIKDSGRGIYECIII